MKQFLCVLKFELGNYFKNKSFLITTVIISLIAIAAVAVPVMIPSLLFGDSDTKQTATGKESNDDDSSKTVLGIVDPLNLIDQDSLKEFGEDITWKEYDSSDALHEAVNTEEAKAGFLLNGLTDYTYIVQNNSMHDSNQIRFDKFLKNLFETSYLTEKGLTTDEIQEFQETAITSNTEILGKDSAKNYWYTYILIFVLYFLILFYGQMIATSVTTEKSNRAIEILVTSVNPNSLIFGKVIAGALSGVIQTVIILGSAFGTYSIFRKEWDYMLDFLFHVPGNVWATYIVFGLLGYLLYAFIYGTLGSLVSKTEDISKSSTFITLIYVASFLISMFGMNSMDSALIKVASFVPFTSSNAMLVRVSMGSVAPWEIAISLILLLGSCIVVGILAAKLFRYGTLMYGNPIKFTSALKKIRENNN